MQAQREAHCQTCDSYLGNIFCELPPKPTETLDQRKIVRNYQKKQNLFLEANPANGIYCIKTGLVKLYKTGPEGKQYILNIMGPKEVLGIESVFSEGPYSATAEVIEAGTMCFISKDLLFELIQQDYGLAIKVSHYLAKELVESEEERLELAQGAVRERFARLLGLLAKTHGRPASKGVAINLKLNREEMAEMIGTAAETAMRLLKEFKEEKLVEVKGKQITVLDQSGLDKLSHRL